MTYPKILAVTVLVIGLSLEATANSDTSFTINSGSFTANAARTTISLSPASELIKVQGAPCSPVCSGNLGTVTMMTAALISGSLQHGGTFGAGGMITITGNGTNGVPSGVLYQGTFLTATWIVAHVGPPANGNFFVFNGVIAGTGAFAGTPATTVQFTDLIRGANPFAPGGSGTAPSSGGGIHTGVPEPGAGILSLMGTGILGIAAGISRRKLVKS